MDLKHLPNLITLARLVLAVVTFWWLEDTLRHPPDDPHFIRACFWSFWFYLVAGFSDFLDGYLARRYGWTSALGRIADPVVDKVMTLGAMVYLAASQGLEIEGDIGRVMPAWAVVLLLGREFLVTALRGLVESRGMAFPAERIGKNKMIAQTAYLLILLGAAGQIPERLGLGFLGYLRNPWLVESLFWVVVGLTLWSGVDYAFRARRMLRGVAL